MAIAKKKPMTSTQKIKVKANTPKPAATAKVGVSAIKGKPMAINPTIKKAAIGVGIGLAGAAVGYGVAKLLGKRKRQRGVAKLKSQVVKKQLKIRNLQLDRKLLKEQLKGI